MNKNSAHSYARSRAGLATVGALLLVVAVAVPIALASTGSHEADRVVRIGDAGTTPRPADLQGTGWSLGLPIIFEGTITDDSGIPLSGARVSVASEGVLLTADHAGFFSTEFTPTATEFVVDIAGPAVPPGTAQALEHISRRVLLDLTSPGAVMPTYWDPNASTSPQKWHCAFSAGIQSRAEYITPLFGPAGGTFQSGNGAFAVVVPAGVVSQPVRIGVTRIKPAYASYIDSPWNPNSYVSTELMQLDVVMVDANWNVVSGPFSSPITVAAKSTGATDWDGDGNLDSIWGMNYSSISLGSLRAWKIPSLGASVQASGNATYDQPSGVFSFVLSEFSTHGASLPPGDGPPQSQSGHIIVDSSYDETEFKGGAEYKCGNSAGEFSWGNAFGDTVSYYWEAGVDLESQVRLLAIRGKLNVKFAGGQSFEFTNSENISVTVGTNNLSNQCFSGDANVYATTRHMILGCVASGGSHGPSHIVFSAESPIAYRTVWENVQNPDPECCE